MSSIFNIPVVFITLSVVLIACSPSHSSEDLASVQQEVGRTDSIDFFVETAVNTFYASTPQAVGLSVGVIYNRDIRTYHFGAIAPGGDEAPADETIYGIASITKTFTGVLLAQAALERRLDLHDDIRAFIEGDDYSNLEAGETPITFYHLMNHTSGLPNTLPDRPEMYPDYPGYEGDVPAWVNHTADVYQSYTRADFLADLQEVVLDTIPGSRFSYSNAAVQLAGFILENVYSKPYEALADSFVFRPLNMSNTGIELSPEKAMRVVTGYDETGREMPPALEAYGAAGALKSTIVDLARYAQWHLDEQIPLVKLSHTPPAGDMEEVEGYTLGLNWQMIRHEDVRRLWQDGNIPGYSSRVVLYPSIDLGIVVLANQLDRSIPGQIEHMVDSILEAIDERTFTLMEAL